MGNSFSYRFDSILDLKEKLEEEKRRELGFATKKYEETEKELRYWEKRKEETLEEWKEKTGSVKKVQTFIVASQEIAFFDRKIEEHLELLNKARQEMDQCRERLIVAKKETKKFEKLKEKDFEEYQDLLQKEENQLMDQIVTHKSSQKQR